MHNNQLVPPAPPPTSLPIVFVLDWDQTVIGDCRFQVQQYTLHNTLRKHGFKPIRTHQVPPAFFPNAKLVRPNFCSFVKAMLKYYGANNVFFFVYTASERNWANTEIPWVEKTCGIRFMRPIFTRDDCVIDSVGNIRKNISRVFPRMIRAIQKVWSDAGYKHAFSSKERVAILEKQVMIIDNKAVYLDRPDKLLLCPDYDYAIYENLLASIPPEARVHPVIQQTLLALINDGMLCPLPSGNEDGMRALTRQYEWLAAKCKSIIDVNKAYENDNFFKYLRNLIIQNGLKTFTPSVIKQLQEAIWNSAKKGAHQNKLA